MTSVSYSEHGFGDLSVLQVCFKYHLSSHTKNSSRTWFMLGVQVYSEAGKQRELSGRGAANRSRMYTEPPLVSVSREQVGLGHLNFLPLHL